MSELNLTVTPLQQKIWRTSKKILVSRGGTRSSKTHSLLQNILTWLTTGYIRENQRIPTGVCSIVRKHKTTLKATVQRDFESIITDADVWYLIKRNQTNRTYQCGGRTVEFFGADDEQKIRGYGSDILYCNEANELNFKKEFFQLLVRTRGPVFIDFNPSDPYVWIKTELEDKRQHEKKDVEVIVSTYKDNPFLPQHQVDEIEYLEKTDPQLWQVYGLGQYGKVEGLIIPRITIIDELPEGVRKRGGGMDFGFNDPATLVDCGWMEPNKVYVDEWIYETGLTDGELAALMKAQGYNKGRKIAADSSKPGSIKEIKMHGFNIHPVKKFQGSVSFGIKLMRQFDIYVTARSTGFIKEQMKYKYKQDKDGNYLDEPIDAFNHSMDAVRYYSLMFLSALNKTQKRRTRRIR